MVDSNFKDYKDALQIKQDFAKGERTDVLQFAEKILTYLGYGVILLISYNLLKD